MMGYQGFYINFKLILLILYFNPIYNQNETNLHCFSVIPKTRLLYSVLLWVLPASEGLGDVLEIILKFKYCELF